MNDLDRAQERVIKWITPIAPDRKPVNAVVKLVEEASELLDAVLNKSPAEVAGELADVQILLLDLAHLHGINILEALHDKMNKNETERKWASHNGVLTRDKGE